MEIRPLPQWQPALKILRCRWLGNVVKHDCTKHRPRDAALVLQFNFGVKSRRKTNDLRVRPGGIRGSFRSRCGSLFSQCFLEGFDALRFAIKQMQ